MSVTSLVSKLLKADKDRKTRFHTLTGQLVISPDIVPALVSTIRRHLFAHYEQLPWLTYPAIRYLENRLENRRIFEFGSGRSTLWYAARAREVFSVENNPEWFERVRSIADGVDNLHLSFTEADGEFVTQISRSGGKFDAIVVDSQPRGGGEFANADDFRVACLRAAISHATDDCLFIVDNTDAMPRLSEEVSARFPNDRIRRMAGWAPGIFAPIETTIIS